MCFSLQVLIEATVSRDGRGYIAIDDIMLLNYPCCECILLHILLNTIATHATDQHCQPWVLPHSEENFTKCRDERNEKCTFPFICPTKSVVV